MKLFRLNFTAFALTWSLTAFCQTNGSSIKNEVLVQCYEGGSQLIKPLCESVGATALDYDPEQDAWRIQLSKRMNIPDAVIFFSNAPGVASAQPNLTYDYFMDPNDPSYPSQWGLAQVSCPLAWDAWQGDPDTVIAIIDSGVDLTHPDLAGKLVPGYDFGEDDSVPMDNQGHGTRCAGVAAASTHNGLGIAGSGFNCRIMPLKASNASGQLTTWAITRSIRYALNRGASVISMSFGSTSQDPLLQITIQYSMGRCLLVAAAGNNGNTTPTYPAAYPGVLSVGGSTNLDMRHSGSSFGPWVRVAAPGVSILTTAMGGGYGSYTGTSYAAPLVAGIAGLGLSAMGTSSTTGPAYVKQILEDSCDPVGNWVSKGRVNALSMLNYVPTGMTRANFLPNSVRATYGSVVSGGPLQLHSNDDQRVRMQAAHYSGLVYVIAGEASFNATILGQLKEIQVSIENRTTSLGTTPFSVRLWRWRDSRWVFIGSTLLNSTDKQKLYRQIYNVNDFVSPVGEIRVGFQADTNGPFEIQTDLLRVSTLSQ